jgi:hypothetical protein
MSPQLFGEKVGERPAEYLFGDVVPSSISRRDQVSTLEIDIEMPEAALAKH